MDYYVGMHVSKSITRSFLKNFWEKKVNANQYMVKHCQRMRFALKSKWKLNWNANISLCDYSQRLLSVKLVNNVEFKFNLSAIRSIQMSLTYHDGILRTLYLHTTWAPSYELAWKCTLLWQLDVLVAENM